jgi:hypothetical protein
MAADAAVEMPRTPAHNSAAIVTPADPEKMMRTHVGEPPLSVKVTW